MLTTFPFFSSFPIEPTKPAKPLPYKVVGPLGGHPHPGPPSAINPCPQPRYCDPARCKDPVGCAPSCADTCCADIIIPPPTPPVGSGGGPCSDACAPKYQADCCMGAPPPFGAMPSSFPQTGPQPVYPRWDLNLSTLLPQACCSLDMYHNLHLLCVIRAVMLQTALHPALPSVALERNLRFMVTERPDQ